MDDTDVGVSAGGSICEIVFDENNVEREPWKICCCTVSRSFFLFIAQVFITSAIIFFCLLQIYQRNDACDSALYSSILTGCIGYLLPGPSL